MPHRFIVITAAVAVLSGGAVATATPAHALGGLVQSFTASATTLTAVSYMSNFPLGGNIPLPAPISRVVDGSSQVVADSNGTGTARYQCNGTAINTYTAVGKELTVPCG